METNDFFETHMRHVLHGDDGQSAGITAAQVIARSRHRRRARTAAVSGVALAAAGAVAVPTALVGGPSHGGAVSEGSGVPAPIAITTRTLPAPASPPSSATPATSAPTVRVGHPGKIELAGGTSITLTEDSVTFTCPGGRVGPSPSDNGGGPTGIGVLTCGTLLGGVYDGDGVPASGEVTVGKKVYPATVLTMAGHPRWSLVYVDLAVAPPPPDFVSTGVYDAAGHVLSLSTMLHGR